MSLNMISANFAIDQGLPHKFSKSFGCYNGSSDKNSESDGRNLKTWWDVRRFGEFIEEIYVNGTQVRVCKLSAESVRFPLFTLTMETPVVSALWADFHLLPNQVDDFEARPSYSKKRRIQTGIAIFESQRCTFFENRGDSYVSRLPFNVEAAWSLKNGILLERRILSSERYPVCRQSIMPCAPTSQCNSPFPTNNSSNESPKLFTIFLMSHPLDEMTPVLLKLPGNPKSAPRLCFAKDENQKIVGTVDDLGLVVFANSKTGLHSIWRIEKAQVEDYAHLYLIDDDGRITVAPEALTAPEECAIIAPSNTVESVALSTPLEKKKPITPSTFNQATPLRRFQHLSINSSPFLSPFKASLQKLKETKKVFTTRLFTDSDSDDPDGEATVGTLDPRDSSHKINLDEHIRRLSAVSIFPQKRLADESYSLQNSAFGSDSVQSLRRIRTDSKCGFFSNRPCSRKNSVTQGSLAIPGVFATSSHPCAEGGLGVDSETNIVATDEPLLPKICLTLLWTEKTKDSDPPGTFKTPAASMVSSPLLFTSGRMMSRPSLGNLLQTGVKRNAETKIANASNASHSLGPVKKGVFLAKDLVDRMYVCLLGGNQKLSCIGVNDEALEQEGIDLLDGRVTYLPAVDAIYVPQSKLTACLEPNDSIVLYSGITKVCILGVIPALVSVSPQPEELNSSDIRPISVQPSRSEVGLSLAKAEIADLLSRIDKESNLLSQVERHLQKNLEHNTSSLHTVPITSFETRADAHWRLCLPVGHQFTLAFMKTTGSVGTGSSGALQCERELQIHLPLLAHTTLVRHCLGAFRCGLPEELALFLLSRWFCHRNPPNTEPRTSELNSFTQFILSTLGLIPEEGSVNNSPMETDVAVGVKRPKAKSDSLASEDRPNDDITTNLLRRLKGPSTEFIAGVRSGRTLQYRVTRFLPDILFCLHLVFENDQLDVLLSEQVKVLGALNHIIARYAKLSSYVEYYSTCGLSSLEPDDLFSVPQLPVEMLDLFLWSPHARAAHKKVPSLNRWYLSVLANDLSRPRYPYLAGINDLAASVATLILIAQNWSNLESRVDSARSIVTAWHKDIALIGNESSANEETSTADLIKKASVNGVLLAYTKSFAKSEADSSFNQRVVLFLSELDTELCKKLTQLPPAFASIIQTTLAKCLCCPPPNCCPDVYRLIGRNDMARQFEIMQTPNSSSSSSHKQRSRMLCGASASNDGEVSTCNQQLSPAERWASLVRPLLPKLAVNPNASTMVSRHLLLDTLENSPACQIAFEDLRLQEAYKMLQTSSHIWLPRCCSDETTFGPLQPTRQYGHGSEVSDTFLLNVAKTRLDMQLAAACIRTSAQPLGKGMLGLGCIVASPPPILVVAPLCFRGRVVNTSSLLSALPVQLDLVRGNLAETRRTNNGTNESSFAASDHPSNALALAILSTVVAAGCCSSLKTACSLSRLAASTRGEGFAGVMSRYLSTGSIPGLAMSAATAVSASNLPHSPSVLAALHWPQFHNGVAAGLMLSPHASIDATWIVQNCKAISLGASAGLTQSAGAGAAAGDALNSTPPSACPYSPTQAGFLFGLGLNGHLNKLSPHYIREFTIQVHDLANTAVMLGLCAGKRRSMDQGVLRLLAVHFRPLLMPEPMAVEMSVPSLCQAAAAFGLGLLFEGSAHRHIASILLAELGRPLGRSPSAAGAAVPGSAAVGAGNAVLTNDTGLDAGTVNSDLSTANDALGSTDAKIANAGGAGGFAGDSRELISLSAGFALGLVLLQRGDSPCGLSDLDVANTLHAYMTGGRRDSTTYQLDACMEGVHQTVDDLIVEVPRPPAGYPMPECLQPHLLAVVGRSQLAVSRKTHRGDASILNAPKMLTKIYQDELDSLGFSLNQSVAAASVPPNPLTITQSNRLIATVDPLEALIEESLLSKTPGRSVGPSMQSPIPALTGSPGIQKPSPLGASASSSQSQQIKESDTYNTDVSAPGAIVALGFAYLCSGNERISNWLQAPNTYRDLEAVRPDLLCLRTIAWGLVNFGGVQATAEWIGARLPECVVEVLTPIPVQKEKSSETAAVASGLVMSTETDVENRGPRGQASVPATPCEPGTSNRSQSGRRKPLSPKLPFIQFPDPFTLPGLSRPPSVDFSTICQAYLHIITGACFVIGLKYAGTCDVEATELLHTMTLSILTGDWWPPNRPSYQEPSSSPPTRGAGSSTGSASSQGGPPRLLDLPPMEQAVRWGAATCLTALAMVVAGSGNLAALRLARKLRAIRLFGHHPRSMPAPNGVAASVPSPAETARVFQVASTLAQLMHSSAMSPPPAPVATASVTQPVSNAAVMGGVLAPEFGLQMAYASVIGLLFLGGGRLTLSNTPEAAALLTISFFPRHPTYAGDNWYHLQCLRHLYVLATKPRRLCGVNVLTNQVEPVTLKYRLKDKPGYFISKRTAVFPSDFWDHGSSIELSCGKMSTTFEHGTAEWRLLKRSLEEAGFFFVTKAPAPNPFSHFEKMIDRCLAGWTRPTYMWQLRLMYSFLQSWQQKADSREDQKTNHSGFLAQSLATRLARQFMLNAHDIQRGLQVYIFGGASEKRALPPEIRSKVISFRIWLNLPAASILRPALPHPKEKVKVSLPDFLTRLKGVDEKMEPRTSYWLYKFYIAP